MTASNLSAVGGEAAALINFQVAQNELSFKTNIFFQHKTSKRNVKCTNAHSVSLSRWLAGIGSLKQ